MTNQMSLPITIKERESDIATVVTRPESRRAEIRNMPPAVNIPIVMDGDEPVFVSNPTVLPPPYRPSQAEIEKNAPRIVEE